MAGSHTAATIGDRQRDDEMGHMLGDMALDDANMEFIELKRDGSTYSAFNDFQQMRTSNEDAENEDFDDPNMFVYGSRVPPDRSIPNVPLQKAVRDYLTKCGIATLSDADGYHWANLMRRNSAIFTFCI